MKVGNNSLQTNIVLKCHNSIRKDTQVITIGTKLDYNRDEVGDRNLKKKQKYPLNHGFLNSYCLGEEKPKAHLLI